MDSVCEPMSHDTLKCLSIGTPNTTIFPFVPNGKWWLLGVPITEHIIITVKILNIGTYMSEQTM